MKKFFLLTFLLVAVSLPLVSVHAQTQAGPLCQKANCTYVPLEPLPGVDQSGSNFPLYISGMFKILITFGALFAVVMLVIAGITYMVSDIGADKKKAKERAKAVLIGLGLLAASWLILYTINPKLLQFNFFNDSLRQAQTAPTGAATGRVEVRARASASTADANSLQIFNGPDAYPQLMEYHQKCKGTVEPASTGFQDGKEYTSYVCQ